MDKVFHLLTYSILFSHHQHHQVKINTSMVKFLISVLIIFVVCYFRLQMYKVLKILNVRCFLGLC